jgi:transcriptional regulator with XRE-family HTH domain
VAKRRVNPEHLHRKASRELRFLLSDNMKKFRGFFGYTQEDLAERCGCHKNFISNIEQGVVNVTAATLEMVAVGLECQVFELLTPNMKEMTLTVTESTLQNLVRGLNGQMRLIFVGDTNKMPDYLAGSTLDTLAKALNCEVTEILMPNGTAPADRPSRRDRLSNENTDQKAPFGSG